MTGNRTGAPGVRTLRPASGPVILIGAAVLAVVLLGESVLRAGWAEATLVAPWVLLALWLVYVGVFASALRIGSDGVGVQNLLRRTEFGWGRVRDIDMRWQLRFVLDDGTALDCYGGPALLRTRRRAGEPEAGATVPAGYRELADLRERWEGAVAADAPIRRSWDVPALLALAVIAAWCVIAMLIAGL